MPKVLSYTPPWLARPSPGFDLFAPKSSSKPTNGHKLAPESLGPHKTIASRGTEVFVAVGNEVRWSDLVLLKERSQAQTYRPGHSQSRNKSPPQEETPLFRVLKFGVHGAIKQLVISPEGEFMAVATSHTIHIVVLPNSSHLTFEDTGPLKLKSFQLGPTAHVLEQAPVSSILWHPLGHRGRCLVTITTDAVVRLWELNKANRYSFSEPTVAVDLRKLAEATSTDDEVGVSGNTRSKGFSPDAYEWEVASACFGGSLEQEGINGWSPMTLWIGMKEGDVYALCPLLPSKWQVNKSPGASTILEHLETAIGSGTASIEDANDQNEQRVAKVNQSEQRISQAQLSWLTDILGQEPVIEEDNMEEIAEIYSRPNSTPICPKLQGPFGLTPDLGFEKDFDISDILVFGLSNVASVDEDDSPEGLSASVVCLLTSNCDVHMCLDREGVEGQWLPSRKELENAEEDEEERTLLVIETVQLLPSGSEERPLTTHPTFTLDERADFSMFVTDETGVFHVSMLAWVPDLESELSAAQIEGAEVRLKVFFNSAQSLAEQLFPISGERHGEESQEISSCIAWDDSDLGHFVLTSAPGQPFAASLDTRRPGHQPGHHDRNEDAEIPDIPLRPSYEPPAVFYQNSKLTSYMNDKVPARYKSSLKQEVRLSAATLEIMTHTHRILSHESSQLGLAASALFSRCERLKLEFKAQILRAAELADRVDKATGNDEDTFEDSGSEDRPAGNAQIELRIEEAKTRQANLMAQHDRIRKKLAKTNMRELTEKEQIWIEEVERMTRAVNKQRDVRDDEPSAVERFEQVKQVKKEVLEQATPTSKEEESRERAENGHGHVKVPSEYRKQKVDYIHKMLEREKAMLDGAQTRLENMSSQLPRGR